MKMKRSSDSDKEAGYVHSSVRLLPLLLLLAATPHSAAVGINYGQVADNLPPPSSVVPLLRSIGATKVRLYDSDPAVLQAFSGTDTEFIVGLPDRCIAKLANNSSEALAWVKANLLPYLPETKITAVTVGNEVLTGNDTTNIRCLVPAMKSLHSALASLKLDGQIAVTTAHSLAVLGASYPSSAGRFVRSITPYMSQLLSFLAKTGSPFLINAYPYFAYKDDPGGVQLDYVLFEANSVLLDAETGLKYHNMLFAQVDAVYTAISAVLGKDKARTVEVRVSETGWPSKGDADEAGATVENAKRYNGNLIRLVEDKRGTPLRPDTALEVYIFALFNENLKPGPTSERNYGLFEPDGTPAYQIETNVRDNYTGRSGNRSTGDGGKNSTATPASDGYLAISSAATMAFLCLGPLMRVLLGATWAVYSASCQ